ncbi:MAG: FtsX-like permease family protein [Burkholderiaceae bacterium]
MNSVSLALRNLLRNRRRSATTLAAMVIGGVTILTFGGYSRNIIYGLETQTVAQMGHLQIQHKDYFLYGTGNPAAYGVAGYRRVIDTVARDPVLAPMLTVVTPTLTLGGIAGNFAAGVSRTVFGRGVVVEDQNRMRAWNEYGLPVVARPLALTGTGDDAVIIGTGVARVLQLCRTLGVADCPQPDTAPAQGASAPQDITALALLEAKQAPAAAAGDARIELLASSAQGAPNVTSLRVVKAETQGVKELDDMYVGLHLARAQRLVYGGDTPQVTAIVVQLVHTGSIRAAKARLEELLATTLAGEPLQVQEFSTLNPFYTQVVTMFGAIFGFMAVLIGAIVLFTVGNTMTMAVVERTTEIGTLRAIGLRRGGIRRLFVSEGLLLGLIGAIVGVVTALAVAWLINHSGLTWTPPGQANAIPLSVRVWGETALILGTAAGLVVVAAVSAWWPARRAAGKNIVDALRHV